MIILLADDEKLVRLGIKNMIEEIEPHTHKFVEARNGKEVIKIFNDTKPDLALVDINMPLMDGLSAIESCQETNTNTRWFILTGEKEFHLAKKAISLGVKDYLLKPISLNELRPILGTTKNSKKEILIKDNDSFELSIISSYNKFFAKGSINNKFYELENNYIYTPYLFSIDGLNNLEDISARLDDILCYIREFMIAKLDDNLRFAIHYIDSENLLLVIRSIENTNINFNSLLNSINSNSCSITLSKFDTYNSELDLYKDLHNLIEYTFVRVLYNLKSIININNDFIKSRKDLILVSGYIYKLSKSYLDKEELLYNEYLNKINDCSYFKSIYKNLDKTYLFNFLYLTIGFRYDTDSSFSSFIHGLSESSLSIFKKSSRSSNDDLVDEIIKYVDDNYMNEIGVSTIASLYDITPNYLSKIFHEKSGIKFVDYITSVRINESKRLLTTSTLSIRDISKKVGYNSSSHFSKQFIKNEGMTPSEFIKFSKD